MNRRLVGGIIKGVRSMIDIDKIRSEVEAENQQMTFDFGVGVDGEDRQQGMRDAYAYLRREGEMDVEDVRRICRNAGVPRGPGFDLWLWRRALPALRMKPGVESLLVWRVEGDVIHDDAVLEKSLEELVRGSLQNSGVMRTAFRDAYRLLRQGPRNLEELKYEVNAVLSERFWSDRFQRDFLKLPGVKPPEAEEDGPDIVFVEAEEESRSVEVELDG